MIKRLLFLCVGIGLMSALMAAGGHVSVSEGKKIRADWKRTDQNVRSRRVRTAVASRTTATATPTPGGKRATKTPTETPTPTPLTR